MQQTNPNSFCEKVFQLSANNTSVRQEIVAGITTFLAMVYSVIVVPGILSQAGFDPQATFIATCLVSGVGSIAMGFFANAPMAIGCAISLTAFTAFSLVIGQKLPVSTALGAIFLMGVAFTLISVTGIRAWILKNLPISIAHGTGIGIGLFLLLIAADGVGMIVTNPTGVLVQLGDIKSFSVMMTMLGLFMIFALEARRVPGGILIVIVVLTLIGFAFDPNVKYNGFFQLPSFGEKSNFFTLDIAGALSPAVLPLVFALVMTAVFDATGTIRAVAGQAGLVNEQGQYPNAGRALTIDSVGSIFSSVVGTAPAAVYIESASGTAAGGRTGLTAITSGVLFLFILFFQPLASLVPSYATAPALTYVGLLMLSNVTKLDFSDSIGAMSGLVTAVFIVFTTNIVTGIMFGFCSLVIARLVAGQYKQLNVGTIIIAVVLAAFYYSGAAI